MALNSNLSKAIHQKDRSDIFALQQIEGDNVWALARSYSLTVNKDGARFSSADPGDCCQITPTGDGDMGFARCFGKAERIPAWIFEKLLWDRLQANRAQRLGSVVDRGA